MSESDEEVEEILVSVEFADPVSDYKPDMQIKFIGLDTDRPIMQYDQKQILRGEWFDALGTKLFFGEKKIGDSIDPAFTPEISKHFECQYMTSKILRMSSYVLNPRHPEGGCTREEDTGMDSEGVNDEEARVQDKSAGDAESATEDPPGLTRDQMYD